MRYRSKSAAKAILGKLREAPTLVPEAQDRKTLINKKEGKNGKARQTETQAG